MTGDIHRWEIRFELQDLGCVQGNVVFIHPLSASFPAADADWIGLQMKAPFRCTHLLLVLAICFEDICFNCLNGSQHTPYDSKKTSKIDSSHWKPTKLNLSEQHTFAFAGTEASDHTTPKLGRRSMSCSPTRESKTRRSWLTCIP